MQTIQLFAMQQLLQAGGAALVAKRLTGKKQSHYVTSITQFHHAPKQNRAHRSFTSKIMCPNFAQEL
jgi:hypothetical protein